MELKEVMEQCGGHSERLPADRTRFGKEIYLPELIKATDAWREVWQKLDTMTVDRLSVGEQRQARKDLQACAMTLDKMTFSLDIIDGTSAKRVRAELLRENPDHAQIIKELFRPYQSWWVIYAYVKSRNLGGCIDFVHVNTMKTARLWIKADSPIVDSIGIAYPLAPRGPIICF